MEKKELKNLLLAKRRIIYALLAGSVAMSISGCENNKEKVQNSRGYYNPSITSIYNTDEEDFVLIDVGDASTLGNNGRQSENDQDKKISKCIDKDISVGIVLTPTTFDEDKIWDNINLLKRVLDDANEYANASDKYGVSLPVFINVDYIMDSYDIDKDHKEKIINIMLEKCSSNGMFVCVLGSDDNLCYIKNNMNCNITEYNACVIIDGDAINYDGPYSYTMDGKGNVYATEDLETIITRSDKRLNTPEKFVSDAIYTFTNGDDIVRIADNYNISVNSLLKYNGLTIGDVKDGTILRIPSLLGVEVPYSNNNGVSLDTPIRGCDLSKHQDIVDFNVIKDKFNFVILKATEGIGYTDDNFEKFVSKCIEYDIPYGAYVINRRDPQELEGNFENSLDIEFNEFFDELKYKEVTYPTYLDIESGTSSGYIEKFLDGNRNYLKNPEGISYIEVMITKWKEKCTNLGFTPGIYCSKSTYEIIANGLTNKDILDGMSIWIADYSYTDTNSLNELNVSSDSNNVVYRGNNLCTADMVQVTDKIDLDGIYDSNGNPISIDVNYCWVDYSKKASKNDSYYNEVYRDFDLSSLNDILSKMGVVGFASLCAVAIYYAGYHNLLDIDRTEICGSKKRTFR